MKRSVLLASLVVNSPYKGVKLVATHLQRSDPIKPAGLALLDRPGFDVVSIREPTADELATMESFCREHPPGHVMPREKWEQLQKQHQK